MAGPLRIATRQSKLALAQANLAKAALESQDSNTKVELIPMVSAGDLYRGNLAAAGGKELFIKALRQAINAGQADCACHSLKDLGSDHPDFYCGAFLPRADPRDALIGSNLSQLSQLEAPVIATSSPRRIGQLSHELPHAKVVPIRGNVDTRLVKLREQRLDALLLASAGLDRLDLGAQIAQRLDPHTFIPAPGQGTIVLECASTDEPTRALLACIDCPASRTLALAERECARIVAGNCSTPLGVLAQHQDDGNIIVRCMLSYAGRKAIGTAQGHDPITVGALATRQMLSDGGQELLDFITDNEHGAIARKPPRNGHIDIA